MSKALACLYIVNRLLVSIDLTKLRAINFLS